LIFDASSLSLQVASREEGLQIQTTESSDAALTRDPVVVLVDGQSASASEIVSGESEQKLYLRLLQRLLGTIMYMNSQWLPLQLQRVLKSHNHEL
jgi:hypothetical protein